MNPGVQVFNPVLLHMRFYWDKAFTDTVRTKRSLRQFGQSVHWDSSDKAFTEIVRTKRSLRQFGQSVHWDSSNKAFTEIVRTKRSLRQFGQSVHWDSSDKAFTETVRTKRSLRQFGQSFHWDSSDKAFTERGFPPRTSDVPWQCYSTRGLYKVKGNGKGKVHLRTGHEGPEGELYSFFNHGARWGEWSTPRPGRFTPGKNRYPLYKRLGGSHGRSDECGKSHPSITRPSSP